MEPLSYERSYIVHDNEQKQYLKKRLLKDYILLERRKKLTFYLLLFPKLSRKFMYYKMCNHVL